MMDLPKTLGAHPWWSRDVLLYGALPGILLAIASQKIPKKPVLPLVGFGLAAGLSFGVASFGTARFAASYAEDDLAGQVWFLGWIATVLFAIATAGALGNTLDRAWSKQDARRENS